MTLFTSNRERTLWKWTAAVLVAIYSTIGLAGTLAQHFGNGLLAGVLFSLCAILILILVIIQALTKRTHLIQVVVGFGILAAYVLVFVRMVSPVERSHLMEYGIVAILTFEALKERASHRKFRVPPALSALVLTAFFGIIDECIQWFVPNRVFDPVDMLFNTMAAVMAIGASLVISWASTQISKS